MSGRVLVAGIGNIFLSDDGFGVEVVRRLTGTPFPPGVRVVDFGIRGVHLAYELGDGYDAAILIDAAPRGRPPGTIYVIEPDLDAVATTAAVTAAESPLMDAHGLEPVAVLSLVNMLGGTIGRVFVVGCEPATVEEGIGLSEPVARAMDEAVNVVRDLIEKLDRRDAHPEFRGNTSTVGRRSKLGLDWRNCHAAATFRGTDLGGRSGHRRSVPAGPRTLLEDARDVVLGAGADDPIPDRS